MNQSRYFIFLSILLLSLAVVGIALAADIVYESALPNDGVISTGVDSRSGDGGGINSLSGSYVAFDPSVGGDTCYIPEVEQTFCFKAESFSND